MIKKCEVCGKEFHSNRKYIKYCSDECKEKGYARYKINFNRVRAKKEIEKRRRKREEEIRKSKGSKMLNKINTIAKETGLSYGEVKKWYPDMDKIKFMANYLGRKGMKPDEPRIVGRTSMLIV